MVPRYQRGGGISHRPASGHPELGTVNDGGHDAPMGPRDSAVFKGIFAAALILGVALIVIVLLD